MIPLRTTLTTGSNLLGKSRPRRANSAKDKQPPCHALSLSFKLSSWSKEATTSSANSLGKRPVTLPIPEKEHKFTT